MKVKRKMFSLSIAHYAAQAPCISQWKISEIVIKRVGHHLYVERLHVKA